MAKKNTSTTIATTPTATKMDPREYAAELMRAGTPTVMTAVAGPAIALPTLTREKFAMLMDEYELTPPIIDVEPGQVVEGLLIGEGPLVEQTSGVKDPTTGLELPGKPLRTWIIEFDDGFKRRIIGGYTLNTEFPPLIGLRVIAVKGEKKDTGKGGRTVREWIVGKSRSIAAE